MPQELNGHGPTAGDYMGGSGDNLNARPDGSTPGGSNGNGGRDSSSSGNTQAAAMQRQMNAILSDVNFNNVLKELQKKSACGGALRKGLP
ncbi:hypothetical protein I5M82_05455 [Serratia marcescens]|jgi:hypothetical protein|uniref:hypothetical protein n=1 Tax=Serratia TaxID=613 RepID=UPI00128CE4DC|nr:hypothetical protein [Serratia marcescens]MBH2668220.1 hypothetical protein [Serratia marcescens]MBH2673383.1 hypothetical protein [Serratia marcescens]MBH3055018.1 hypothetical protein [Serratia marcescens]MBH3299449.1 hypothetical protein [Serratia marcescens]MDP8798506.1 hypothetical protein [Serratia marcescens]